MRWTNYHWGIVVPAGQCWSDSNSTVDPSAAAVLDAYDQFATVAVLLTGVSLLHYCMLLLWARLDGLADRVLPTMLVFPRLEVGAPSVRVYCLIVLSEA